MTPIPTPTTTFPIDGGCDCRRVRYRMTSAPLFVHACHCRWCQRESGAAFALNAMIEADRVQLLGDAPELVHTPSASGQGQHIARCPACRVAVWSHYAGAGPRVSFVRVGTLDDPDVLPPDIHIFTASKQPWVLLPPGTPAVPGYYDREQHWPAASLARRAALLASAAPDAPAGEPAPAPTPPRATLHFLAGKMAAGKSTLARALAAEHGAVLVCEDLWLQRLYPTEITDFATYLQHAARLKAVVAPHVQALLAQGLSVVMDFPANTPAARAWMRSIFEAAGADHRLHHVAVPDHLCKQQLARRNHERPEGSMVMSEAQFDQITALFQPPLPAEGFTVQVHARADGTAPPGR